MAEPIAPPYPSDTRARGWRFEVDMEKVKASDTWLRAKTGAMRGALLLLWSEAWQQTPCGSLPDDDELLALLLDMEDADFKAARAILMRGWRPALDGRLYHETITDRVLAMLTKRAKDADRTAKGRASRAGSPPKAPTPAASPPPPTEDSGGVTCDAPATSDAPAGDAPVSSTPSTKHQFKDKTPPATPVPPADAGLFDPALSGPEPPKLTKPPIAKEIVTVTVEQLMADGLEPETAAAWLEHRRVKKAKLSPLAWWGFKAEVVKAGWTLEAAVRKAIARNWVAFEGAWVGSDQSAKSARAETTYQRSRRERYEEISPELAAKPPGAAHTTTIEGASNVIAIGLG